MALTYNLAPQPRLRFYYPEGAGFGSLAGQPLSNGKIYTYSSLNHATPKTAYTSNIGSPPPAHTNPIILDGNGEAAVYWELDDTDITDLYYIEIYDSDSSPPTGSPIITADNYDGTAFGEAQVQASEIDFNFIRNPQFSFPWFKTTYNLKLDGASPRPTSIDSWIGAEWGWAKNNTSCTETVSYESFILGQSLVPNNPNYYLSWNIQTPGTGETFKVISQKLNWHDDFKQANLVSSSMNSVQLFSGQMITLQLWARSTSSSNLNVNIRQHFGNGGSASPDVVTSLLSRVLTPSWTFYSQSITVPDVSSKVVDSTSFTQIEIALPLDAAIGSNIDVTNIQLELGATASPFQYKTYHQQFNEFGDWFSDISGTWKFYTQSTFGWLLASDGLTIGNAGSGAGYAHEHGFALFKALYNNITDTYAPVSGGRTTDALTDFDLSKTITIPPTESRFIGHAGSGSGLSTRNVGETFGKESHVLTVPELASHTHTYTKLQGSLLGPTDGATIPISDVNTETQPTGGDQPHTIMNPGTYLKLFVKV